MTWTSESDAVPQADSDWRRRGGVVELAMVARAPRETGEMRAVAATQAEARNSEIVLGFIQLAARHDLVAWLEVIYRRLEQIDAAPTSAARHLQRVDAAPHQQPVAHARHAKRPRPR